MGGLFLGLPYFRKLAFETFMPEATEAAARQREQSLERHGRDLQDQASALIREGLGGESGVSFPTRDAEERRFRVSAVSLTPLSLFPPLLSRVYLSFALASSPREAGACATRAAGRLRDSACQRPHTGYRSDGGDAVKAALLILWALALIVWRIGACRFRLGLLLRCGLGCTGECLGLGPKAGEQGAPNPGSLLALSGVLTRDASRNLA